MLSELFIHLKVKTLIKDNTMKTKHFILLIVLLSIAVSNAFAQRLVPPNDTLKTNSYNNEFTVGILPAFVGSLNINYERLFNKQASSIVFNGTYTKATILNVNREGYQAGIQYRSYILKKSYSSQIKDYWDGIFVAPQVSYRYTEITRSGKIDKIERIGAGVCIGAKYVFLHRLTLDLDFGIQYINSDIQKTSSWSSYQSNIFAAGYTGIKPNGSISFGFKF